MQDQQATVFVIDDDPEVCNALDRLLRSDGWQVRVFASAQAFLEASVPPGAGCILLDVDMPGMTGPQLHALLKEAGVGLPVIYLTGRSNVPISVQAMKRGALDFLEKPIDADALLPALALAVDRHRQSLQRDALISDIHLRLATLSAREREVFELVVLGRLNKQIAGELQIAEKTVKVHRGRVMSKMKVRSVAQLVHLYEQVLSAGAGTG
jgi:FixJ family two-component response regulator